MMRAICCFILMMLVQPLASQSIVKGKVLDADTGEPLAGAHIYLLNHWRVGAASDELGAFTLTVPPEAAGDSLICSYLGYTERILSMENAIMISMHAQTAMWEEVKVTARALISEEFKYQEINKLDIYTNPAAKADPVLAVNSLPAATTTDESANISLRGSSPLETGIYFNNVPLYDAVRYAQLSGIGTFSIFNTSIIKEVTVFPGNPPLEFGNATSGIIALTTDDQVVKESSNSAILSLANFGYTREQRLSSHQSLKLFSNYQPSTLIKALNHKSLQEIRSFRSGDLGLYWYGTNKNFQWRVFNYSLLEAYDFNFQHPSFSGVFNQKKGRSFLTAGMERTFKNSGLALNLGTSFSEGKYAYSNVAFGVFNKDLFGGLTYHYSADSYQFKTGVSYDHRHSRVDGTVHQFPYALGNHHPTDTLNDIVRSPSLESFAYFKYFISDQLALGTGVRKNIPTESQKSRWGHQLNLSFNEGPWQITLGAGKYYKYGLQENSGSLLEVNSRQYALDANLKLEAWSLAASVFSKKTGINGDYYKVKGVEFFVQYQANSSLRGSLSMTWMDANGENSQPYPYDLSYFLKGNIAYLPGNYWTIETILVARQGVPYDPLDGAVYHQQLQVYQPLPAESYSRMPAYFSIGTSISKIFVWSDDVNFIAFASVNNLTDHENVRGYLYTADYLSKSPSLFSKRTVYIGVVINF